MPTPVLARHRATEFNACLENVAAERFRAVPFVEVVAVEQNERMHVAVARMEHVDAAERVLLFHLFDAREQRPDRGDDGEHRQHAGGITRLVCIPGVAGASTDAAPAPSAWRKRISSSASMENAAVHAMLASA